MALPDIRLHLMENGGLDVRLFHRLVDPLVRPPRFHCHPAFEIALFKAGSGIYNVGERQIAIAPGDVFFFAGNEPHYITRIDPGEKMLIMNLHVSRSFLCPPAADAFDARYLRFFLLRGEGFENKIASGTEDAVACRGCLLAIEAALTAQGEEGLAEARARLMLMLAKLAQAHAPVQGPASRPVADSQKRLEASIAYIDQNLTEPLTLSDIAREAGMSRAYFSSLFKRMYGITLWEYIIAKRIYHAAGLLQGGDTNVLDVALCSGFNNTANFNRAFKKYTGKTPSAYVSESLAPGDRQSGGQAQAKADGPKSDKER